jgi:GntR family transcriptional repressor for pyruvate dehydrogenase complex
MEANAIVKKSVTEQLTDLLKQRILRGELKPGDKLPTEMELCSLYSVSRTSVRQAIAALASLGLVEAKVGGGTFVRMSDGSEVMEPILLHTFLNAPEFGQLAEFRRLMEPAVTELACEKASAEEIEKLAEIYAEMEENENDLEAFARLDWQFHLTIAQISKNPYIIKVYEAMSEILQAAFAGIVAKNGNHGGWHYHGEIVEAFRRKDAARAGSIMREHMEHLKQENK